MQLNGRRTGMIAAGVAAVAMLGMCMRPSPLAVETTSAARGPLRVTIDEEGHTRVRDRFTIAAPVTGRLQRIALREGDVVRAGEVIARIAPAPLDPSLSAQGEARLRAARELASSARSRVSEARASLEQERRSAQRQEVLLGAGAISAEQMERVRLAVRSAEEGVAAAEAQARAAEAEIAAARAALLGGAPSPGAAVEVRAPSAGRVLRIPDASERVVAAGTPLLEIGDPGATEVVVDVLSTDAVRLRPGVPVEIVDWGGDRPLEGVLRSIEPAALTKVSALGVEEQRVNALIDVRGADGLLGDGYRVEVRMLVWETKGALLAPSSAVFQERGRWLAYVVRDGRAVRRAVQVGHRGGGQVEILSGLEEGDELIVFPSEEVTEGKRVRPVNS